MSLSKIEAKMSRHDELQTTIKRAEEEKERLKESLADLMEEEGMTEHRVMLDGAYDLKATAGSTSSWKLDTESMAQDLGIAESSCKDKETLITLVEQGKLSLEQYKRYFYLEDKNKVGVRKVKAL